MDPIRVPADAPVMYVNRLGLTPFGDAVEEDARVCSHGRWHTVRAVGRPIFGWDHDIAFAFMDGGGCRGHDVDAVFTKGVIVTVYAPGKVPAEVDQGDAR